LTTHFKRSTINLGEAKYLFKHKKIIKTPVNTQATPENSLKKGISRGGHPYLSLFFEAFYSDLSSYKIP
jgi:hypothetical protein